MSTPELHAGLRWRAVGVFLSRKHKGLYESLEYHYEDYDCEHDHDLAYESDHK